MLKLNLGICLVAAIGLLIALVVGQDRLFALVVLAAFAGLTWFDWTRQRARDSTPTL